MVPPPFTRRQIDALLVYPHLCFQMLQLMLLLLQLLMLRLPLLVDAAAAAAVFDAAAAGIHFAATDDANSTDAQHAHQ